jgi:regulator of sirC expression with transglutaminase-like and TPR domain
VGLAGATLVDAELAAAQAAEEARRDRISVLLNRLEGEPLDVATLSDLADANLAGEGPDDLASAARVLQLVISLEPDNLDAYRDIIGAYLRAGDEANAGAALDAYAEVETDAAEVAFYRGLIAFRAGEASAARAAFDEFLRLKPDDERASMVRSLRAEALDASD